MTGSDLEVSGQVQAGTGDEKPRGREVTVDWFEGSVKEIDVDVVFEVLEEHLGSVCRRAVAEVLRDDMKGFDAKGPLGLRVRADRVGQVDSNGRRRSWAGVRVPGELCRAVGTAKVLSMARALFKAGDYKVSRVDVALDDFGKTFTPRMFAEACVVGGLDDEEGVLSPRAVTRVRRDNWEWSRRKGGCFWMGSRHGARLLRVYDKDKESDGRIQSTRIELQSRDEFATALVYRMLEAFGNGDGIAGVFLEHLVEFIDLRAPQGPRSKSHKWPRLSWWQALVGDAKGIATPGRCDTDVWAWLDALRRQFGGALTVLLRAAGVDGRAFASATRNHEAARLVVAAVKALVGGSMPELSADHEMRLDQLVREQGNRGPGGPKARRVPVP